MRDDLQVLCLRAEQDHLRVLDDPDAVSGRLVEEVAAVATLVDAGASAQIHS